MKTYPERQLAYLGLWRALAVVNQADSSRLLVQDAITFHPFTDQRGQLCVDTIVGHVVGDIVTLVHECIERFEKIEEILNALVVLHEPADQYMSTYVKAMRNDCGLNKVFDPYRACEAVFHPAFDPLKVASFTARLSGDDRIYVGRSLLYFYLPHVVFDGARTLNLLTSKGNLPFLFSDTIHGPII
jgi:hypothetical protein